MLTTCLRRRPVYLFFLCLLLSPLPARAIDGELSLLVYDCETGLLDDATLDLSWYDGDDTLKDTMVEYTDYGEALFEFSGLESGDYVVIVVTPARGDPYDSFHQFYWIGDGNNPENWTPPPPGTPGGGDGPIGEFGADGPWASCDDFCGEDNCTILAYYD